METYYDILLNKQMKCKTLEDWKDFAEWLISEVYVKNASALSMEAAILEKYGQKALEELVDIALELEEKYTPAEIVVRNYGYTKDNMIPISDEKAYTLLEDGREVYLLHNDNTETMISHPIQIKNHNGPFGITTAELERIAKDYEAERGE